MSESLPPRFLAARCPKCNKYRAGLQETSTEQIKVTCCKVTYLARVVDGAVVLTPHKHIDDNVTSRRALAKQELPKRTVNV